MLSPPFCLHPSLLLYCILLSFLFLQNKVMETQHCMWLLLEGAAQARTAHGGAPPLLDSGRPSLSEWRLGWEGALQQPQGVGGL